MATSAAATIVDNLDPEIRDALQPGDLNQISKIKLEADKASVLDCFTSNQSKIYAAIANGATVDGLKETAAQLLDLANALALEHLELRLRFDKLMGEYISAYLKPVTETRNFRRHY